MGDHTICTGDNRDPNGIGRVHTICTGDYRDPNGIGRGLDTGDII